MSILFIVKVKALEFLKYPIGPPKYVDYYV